MAGVQEPEVVVAAHDASYVHGSYRSFEFASFDAVLGCTTALVAQDGALARDLLLAIAGLVRPTSGSLAVLGVELADASAPIDSTGVLGRFRRDFSSLRRERLPRGSVGIGVVSGLFEVAESLTVEDCVRREFELRRRGTDAARVDALDHLAVFGLATHADRPVCELDADARARLSAALACVGYPRVACVDLSDPFCRGFDVGRGVLLARDLNDIARAHDVALMVGTCEPRLAAVLDDACPLDMESADALSPCAAPFREAESHDSALALEDASSEQEVASHAVAAC